MPVTSQTYCNCNRKDARGSIETRNNNRFTIGIVMEDQHSRDRKASYSIVVRSIFCVAQLIAAVCIFRSIQFAPIDDGDIFSDSLSPGERYFRHSQDESITTNTSNVNNVIKNRNGDDEIADANATTSTLGRKRSKRLPTLDELTSISPDYRCPNGTEIFENIVLPHNITHANRKIPNAVHVTAKTRCVTPQIKKHILQWKFPDHSLYFHDDNAVYRLLDYAVDDSHGYELITYLTESVMCISNGATLTDLWRLVVLYYYGGIYTDLDNSPGKNYSTSLISPETDSFFFRELTGSMSQYYMASSKHHPILLHILSQACSKRSLYQTTNNVMRNNPATNTGPRAVKEGMISFLKSVDVESDGYSPEGIYYGGVGPELSQRLLWYGGTSAAAAAAAAAAALVTTTATTIEEEEEEVEYPSQVSMENRSVTVFGRKEENKLYIDRMGLKSQEKSRAWEAMNMTHYQKAGRKVSRTNKISCKQHVCRMNDLTSLPGSFYFEKKNIEDLLPKYEYRQNEKHWFDIQTGEKLVPWSEERKRQAEAQDDDADDPVLVPGFRRERAVRISDSCGTNKK